MLTLDQPQEAKLTERGIARGVRVHVRPNGPAVDLPPGKTTVGSSPRCNVRIQQPGVQPLHCLILNEASGLSVRRWAGETVLNGRPVEESAIASGDCLRVGPVELEIAAPQAGAPVVTLAASAPAPTGPVTPTASPVAPVSLAPVSLRSVSAAPFVAASPTQTVSIAYREGRELARSRSRKLLAAVREHKDLARDLQQRISEREQELERAASDRKDFAGQLQNLSADLADARRQIAEQQASAQAYQEVSSQNEQLGREVCSMIERIEQLTNELTETSRSLHSTVADKESLAAETRRSVEENAQLREQLQQQTSRCSHLAAERDAARGQIESLRGELRSAEERVVSSAGNAERYERELSALQQRAAELANQNSGLCGERDEAWRQCESLRSNVHALSERESSMAQSVARLEHDNSQQQLHIGDLSNQVAALRGERDEAWRQCESLRSNVHALSERESSMAQSVARLEHETSQQQQQVGDLSNQVAALCGERDEAWQQCEALRSNVHALSERESSLAQSVARLEQETSQQQLHAGDLSNQVAVLCDERDQAWRQCEALRSDVQALSERESSLVENVGRLEHENSRHQQQAIELANQLAALCGERDDARRQCEALREKVRAFSGLEDERSSQIALLSDERDAAWRQCEALRSEVQSLKERAGELSEGIRRLEHEKSEVQSHETELSMQIAMLGNERDDAWRQCDTLRTEVLALNDREAALTERLDRHEQESAKQISDSAELASQVGALRAERDDLHDQNVQLRSQVNNFAQERAAMTEEHAAGNRELESLRTQLQEAADRADRHTEQLAQLAAENGRYREEADRLSQLEQQVRDAVADRENTSSELYRALLQLAEMQERDDHNAALEAAYSAVNVELEKSVQDIAALQAQIDRLTEERLAEVVARESLDQRTAELIEAHQQLAYDKTTLNAELTQLQEQLEAARRHETELAGRLETAETWRERLSDAEQTLSMLTKTVTQLQGELDGKASLEASTAAVIAERDQQIADYTRMLAESGEAIRRLERESAALSEVETRFEKARFEWRQELEEAERNHSQQLQRVTQLESELTDARAAAELAAKSAVAADAQSELDRVREEWRRERDEALRDQSQLLGRVAVLESQLAEALSAADEAKQLIAEQKAQLELNQTPAPAAFEWRGRGNNADASTPSFQEHATEGEPDQDFGNPRVSTDADSAPGFSWTAKNLDSEPESDADPFEETAAGSSAPSHWAQQLESAPAEREIESSADDAWRLTQSQEESAARWSCTTPTNDSPPDQADASWRCSEPTTSDSDDIAAVNSATTPAAPPASFIERYSHLFSNDAAVEPQAEQPAPPLQSREDDMRKPSGLAGSTGGASTPAGEGEEESIEDYMAKLLQRVRGESAAQMVATSAAPKQDLERSLPMTAPAGYDSAPLTVRPLNATGDATSAMGFDPSKRKASMPAPQTDLEALRALANESARRAISRHAVRKHRRTLITKVIVSTLAGVTSLWLLLESERWWNLQSITACGSMLVAAYWVAETFRTLLESLRVKTSDETDHEIEELSARLRSPLPIDVEGSRAWTTQPLVTSAKEPAADRTLAESELSVEN